MTNVRKQRGGKQRGWSLEELRLGFSKFNKLYGHYPAAHEIDVFEFLPSSRSIQRRFGGLVELRHTLELKSDVDLRKGEHSSKRAIKINARAHTVEKKVYEYLVKKFGIEFVHREYFFTDDKRTRTDFFIYYKTGNFAVDVFYPSSRHNLLGCLNSKMRTYGSEILLQYPVIFLQMNEDISSDEIVNILEQKKNKLLQNQFLMTFDMFKEFCENKKER